MKKIKYFLVLIIMSLSLTSCMATYAQYVDDEMYVETDVTYSTVVTCGSPYYYNGYISYYYYNGWYYYPYIWNNVWYFYPTRTLRPRDYIFHPHRGFRPHNGLGDLHNHHPHDRFGGHHQDMGRGRHDNDRYRGNPNPPRHYNGGGQTPPRNNGYTPRHGEPNGMTRTPHSIPQTRPQIMTPHSSTRMNGGNRPPSSITPRGNHSSGIRNQGGFNGRR